VPDADTLVDGYALGELNQARRFVVVSTQGKGDEAALRTAVATEAAYHAFVGSRRKMAALRTKLMAEGIEASAIDRIKAPAGLDLGAITPEEIAMSILAEITIERRRGQRGAGKYRPSSRGAKAGRVVRMSHCDCPGNVRSGAVYHQGGFARATLTGEDHEQICDKAFDTRHVRDGAGGGSDGHTSQGRDEQQQAYEEA
jgi:hypothetical protein